MKNSDTPAMPSDIYLDPLDSNSSKYPDRKMPCSGLTKREQACIALGIPETGDTELDELILKSERKRIAAMSMQNVLSSFNPYEHGDFDSSDFKNTVVASVGLADALLKELSK